MGVLILAGAHLAIVASATAKAGAIAVVMVFVVLGVLMALFPRQTNRIRMNLRGQLEGSDTYIRILGIGIGCFAIALVVVIALVAK